MGDCEAFVSHFDSHQACSRPVCEDSGLAREDGTEGVVEHHRHREVERVVVSAGDGERSDVFPDLVSRDLGYVSNQHGKIMTCSVLLSVKVCGFYI